MRKKFSYRMPFSISNIGKRQFRMGVFAGLIATIALAFGFSYTRETLRVVITSMGDLLIDEPFVERFYEYFFACLSILLGFLIAIWIWLLDTNQNRCNRRRKRYFKTIGYFIFWMTIWGVFRMGTNVFIYFSSGHGFFHDSLKVGNHGPLLYYLIVLFLFLFNFSLLNSVYKSRNFLLVYIPLLLIGTPLLAKAIHIDKSTVHSIHYADNKRNFDFIKLTLDEAEQDHKITYNRLTERLLHQKYHDGLVPLIDEVIESFNSKKEVSLDTIILAKIIVHNRYRHLRGSDFFKHYQTRWWSPHPYAVRYQLYNYGASSKKKEELFKLFSQFITVANECNVYVKNEELLYYRTEPYRAFWISENQYQFITEIREELLSEEKFEEYHYLLPELKELKLYSRPH
ncbi:hypothetical protein [Spongiivirga citrea]|uniref:Uncharacterized protein n=1 Tax=Spongiivirga citrea TaxID=1481457 RepID=A0A6M0CDC3_9FLAO|nr:hypothetical protein [Spongiivirga citrea]NER15711.1 hypothetical protein [Spongiivirga citrea]